MNSKNNGGLVTMVLPGFQNSATDIILKNNELPRSKLTGYQIRIFLITRNKLRGIKHIEIKDQTSFAFERQGRIWNSKGITFNHPSER